MDPPEEVELLCIICGANTVHTLQYKADQLTVIECTECHRRVEVCHEPSCSEDHHAAHAQTVRHDEMSSLYRADFLKRVLTKPRRMEEELREDLTLFMATLPLRLITKPYRLLRDVLNHQWHA